jgi:prepilin-type N-terminal cleavage/methylation domain-containing protein
MRRTGFTLIEILLAIALLVMVLSLVGPALFSRVAPKTFDYTIEQFAAELRLAREDARRTGKVRLIYAARTGAAAPGESASGEPRPGEIRIESRLTPPEDTYGIPAERSRATAEFFRPDRVPGAGSGTAPDGEETPRLLMNLPDGYDLLHRRPDFLIADDAFGGPDPRLDPRFDPDNEPDPFDDTDLSGLDLSGIGGLPDSGPDASESMLLIVCVPDGTVLLARPVWITDPDQRAARLIVGPASGVIRFEIHRARPDQREGFGQELLDPESPTQRGEPRSPRSPRQSGSQGGPARPSRQRPGGTP